MPRLWWLRWRVRLLWWFFCFCVGYAIRWHWLLRAGRKGFVAVCSDLEEASDA